MFTSLQRSFAREEIKKIPNSLQSAHLMEMDHSLVQRYASDRHKILDFILRSNLIKEIRSPNGTVDDVSDIDLHSISADYVIDCVKSGGVVDILEATKKYYDESTHPLPVMIHSQAGNSYFLLCDLDLSGSPPRRIPPSIDLKPNNTSSLPDHLTSENNVPFRADYSFKDTVEAVIPLKLAEDVEVLSLGLESLKSGLSDDNLRESAYEIFLASMVFSGIDIHPNDYRRKEKSSKFLSRLKSKQDKVKSEHLLRERHLELIATVRIQMQISEAMDVCIRQRLMQFAPRNICGQIDVPQVSIGLLKGMLKSDFLNEKSYMQWRNRQANILEELFCSSAFMTSERSTIGSALAKIRNSNEWDFIMTPTERAEVVLAIRQIALKLSSMPGKFGMKGETYHWTAGYNLNIRLYERLLFGVFDILEESQLIAEAKDILMLIEMTWDTLGITQKMHDALFGWVLFQQFVVTDEAMLLEHAILQVEKVLSAEDNDGKDRLYMDSLVCSRICNGIELKLSLVQAILFSMSIWCDNKLQDYHLHFSQEPCNFKRVMTLASALRVVASDECSDSKSLQSSVVKGIAARNVEVYVEKSTEAAYRRAADIVDLESKAKRIHPLALLANELKLIAKKEFTVFSPVLCHWCREARLISAKLLHQLYGDRLKPFLIGASSLSEDVRSVFPAADMLECELTAVYNSACKDIRLHQALDQDLDHYQIGEISRSLILDWVIAQNTHILEWTRRVFDLEEWEPLSSQQRQAASTIEVFRIFEETVDQLFGLDLPMDIIHLQALLSIIFHSLDSYVREIVNQLVEKNHLIPSSPALTRYKKAVIPLMKKKLVRSNLLDDKVNEKLNMLTIPKLCVRLSTLHYIIKQLDAVEDSIRKSWALVKPSISRIWTKEESPEILEMNFSMGCESVDALFDTTFNSIRNTATDVIIKICDFTGARVVFWDMRESFLFRLYHGNVEDARLDSILPHVDTVLHLVCSLIDDTLRDRVVLSIYRSLLEGFVWLYLDGGPSRAFSDSDIIMMEDDLNMLKVFFVADGEGLPQLLVEQEAKTAEHILSLFSLQTETLIQMLMTASKDISTVIYSSKHGSVCMDDAHTLVRVLCHKKDGEASKFLKMQYQLPTSSEYDDTPLKEPTLRSPLISDLMKHSASFHWSDKGQSSFRSMKKKLHEATSEIRHAW